MTIFDHIENETDVQDLLKIAPMLRTDTGAQQVALQVLEHYSIACSLSDDKLNSYVTAARKYLQQLKDIRTVKAMIRAIDCVRSGAELQETEQYIYSQASDMQQFYQWLARLTQQELYFVLQSVATSIEHDTDIIQVINAALASKAKKPLRKHEAAVCQSWISISWTTPWRSTLRIVWPRKALDTLFV